MNPSLALVIHFHQPVANLDRVVEKATERCYRPFLETLDSFPGIPMTLHYSGCLLEWLEANAPDVTERLRGLVERGQVELMTGGFYEPVLASLPRRDQLGQIQMLTEHLENRYGARPAGLWLTERVWEQDVVPAVAAAGVRYTVVDDTMFHGVGISDEQLTGAFVTEHEGRPLLVYAGDRNLRYLIPYKRPERILEYVTSQDGERLFVYADDGEKFGEWPDTYERVHRKGWLKRFFELLSDQDRVRPTTLGHHAAANRPAGRVYLASSSYDEMMRWALPPRPRLDLGRIRRALERHDPHGALRFIKGAPWRAFLAAYPEVNHLQKRMVQISETVHRTGAPEDAVKELYKAQCNCAYWHGAFGGVYISFMRAGLWHHLMRAEASVSGGEPSIEWVDLDADTEDEILLHGRWGAAVVDPSTGRLVEFDDYEVGANLLTVMARRREAYHLEDENPPDEVIEEEDEDEMPAARTRTAIDRSSLTFDPDGRGALIDVVDGERVPGPYDARIEGDSVNLTVDHGGLRIDKRLTPGEQGLDVVIEIVNTSTAARRGTYATESFVCPLDLGREMDDVRVDATRSGWRVDTAEADAALEVALEDGGEVAADVVGSTSVTLDGTLELVQGARVLVGYELDLAPGAGLTVRQKWRPVPNAGRAEKKERGVSA